MRDDVDRLHRAGSSQRLDDEVTFLIGAVGNLVRDLEGEEREAHTFVVRAGTHPVNGEPARELPALRAFPEPHVVALARVSVDLPLEGDVLLLAENVERADGCLRIAPAQQRGRQRAPRGGRGDRIGLGPACRGHGLPQFALGPDHGQVHRIAQDAVAGAGPADEVVRDVEAAEDFVDARQQRVRGDQPHGQEHPDLLGPLGEAGQQEVVDGPANGDRDQHVQQTLHDGDDGSPAAAPTCPGAGLPRMIRLPGGHPGRRAARRWGRPAWTVPFGGWRVRHSIFSRCSWIASLRHRVPDCTDNRIVRAGVPDISKKVRLLRAAPLA